MQVDIEGTIIKVMEERTGTSARSGNQWRRQDYVIETQGQYPRKCLFTVADGNIDMFGLREGKRVKVTLSIDAHEYNGRWFNDFRAISVADADAPQASSAAGMPPIGAPAPAQPSQAAADPAAQGSAASQIPAGAQPLPWENGAPK